MIIYFQFQRALEGTLCRIPIQQLAQFILDESVHQIILICYRPFVFPFCYYIILYGGY